MSMLLLLSCPVVSDSLWPHGLQPARPFCPSPLPEVCPSSHPLHWGCHPAISSSDTLFSFCPQSFQASETFPVSQLFTSDDQNIGVSASASVLPMSIQGWFPLRLTSLVSLLSKGLSGVFSRTTVQRHLFFGALPSLLSSCHIHRWPLQKTIASTIWTFVSRVMSLLFNTLSRFVIAFLLTSGRLLISVTILSDLGAQEEEICHYFHLFTFYLSGSNGARCHGLSFF